MHLAKIIHNIYDDNKRKVMTIKSYWLLGDRYTYYT